MASNIKTLWRGSFNYNRMPVIEYAYAFSKEQARVVICHRLAKKHGVHPAMVLSMFNGSRDNFNIEIEMEVKEVEGETDMVEDA